jgi:hypothetical protein
MQSTLLIPVGRAKGEPIASCSLENLDWTINFIAKKLREEPTGRFAADNRRWLDEAQRVFGERSEGVVVEGPTAGAAPAAITQPRPHAPLATQLVNVPVGAIREAAAATTALVKARELGHLISPAPAVGNLPEGCAINVSAVVVDIDRETYAMSGTSERGLSKVALDKIASALGVDWDPQLSQRLDDGSHPHYCHFQAVGRVRNFDGTWRTIQAHKELDLRDGSALIEDILAREAKKQQEQGNSYKGDGGKKEIAGKRLHILSLCETEARLRAVRSMGLRTGYTREELAKPFVIAQISFDGYSEDPEARAQFREGIMANFLGGSRALYGKPPVKELQQHAPPPPLSAYGDAGDEDDGPPNYGFSEPRRTGTGGPY